MSIHYFKSIQQLPVNMEAAWSFFSSPKNLNLITPSHINFIIRSNNENTKIYSGQKIEYTVNPLLKIPLLWITEIKEVNEPFRFIDEQIKGPFKKWHHCHSFKKVDGGVEMVDEVTYQIPFGIMGDILNKLIIKNKIEVIFNYRTTQLKKIFGTM